MKIKCHRCYKKTRILLYRGNLNKGKILYPYEKITLIIREDVLLEGEGMVCLQSIETIVYIEEKFTVQIVQRAPHLLYFSTFAANLS